MRCEKIEELLSPYLEDELSREEKKVVDDHLQACESCAALLSLLKETRESLTGFPELEVSENLLNRLSSIPSKKKRFRLSFDFLLQPSLQPVLAAASILLVLASSYFFNPDKKFINKSIDRRIHLGFSQVEKLYAKAESFTDSLGEYKDDIIVSLKSIKLFGESKD